MAVDFRVAPTASPWKTCVHHHGGTTLMCIGRNESATIQVPSGVRPPSSGARPEGRANFGGESKEGVVVMGKRRFTEADSGNE